MCTLPKPLGCVTSTAIATMHLSVLRPGVPPCSTPPTIASSTSTSPAISSVYEVYCLLAKALASPDPGDISHPTCVQAFSPTNCSWRGSVTCHADSNHVVRGARVFSRIVPALTDVCYGQYERTKRRRVWLQGSAATSHAGHLDPLDQRKLSRGQAAS
jgi:hypothetical protein